MILAFGRDRHQSRAIPYNEYPKSLIWTSSCTISSRRIKSWKSSKCSAGTSHSSPQNMGILRSHSSLLGTGLGKPTIFEKSQKAYFFAKIWFISYQWSRQQISKQWNRHWICPSWSRQIDDYNRNNIKLCLPSKLELCRFPGKLSFNLLSPATAPIC